MEIEKLRIYGSPHIGVYVFVNNHIAIIPPGVEEKIKNVISEVLNVDVVESKIAGSILIGVLIAGNDNGLILPRTLRDDEYEFLKKNTAKYGLNLYISRSKVTALGNVFLVNNNACIVGKEFEQEELKQVSDVLDVEVYHRNILELPIPGSLAVVNDKGGVIHPDVSDSELEDVSKFLRVGLERATVNSGVPFIKSGLIVNNKGIIVGENTTGPEILRIRRGFGE